jgi:murein L,D-transpeptidase YafK
MKPAWRKPALLCVLLCALLWSIFALYRPAPLPPKDPVPPIAAAPLVGPVDFILVEKALRKMTVFRDGVALKSYSIDLGFAPLGPKTHEGDGRTPEGVFRIDRRNPNSKFHLSLGIDYPQDQHRRAAKAAGVSPGGDIMIHGLPNLLPAGMTLRRDWTAGCIAITNAEMEELFAAVAIGTVIELRP